MATAAVEFNQDGDKLMSTFTDEDSVNMNEDPEVGLLWKHNLVIHQIKLLPELLCQQLLI